MFYKPSRGKMKDDCMFFHDGKYYLYSMYAKELKYDNMAALYNNVWLAISEDGVHFQDYGCVVEDAPFPIWAMKVYATNRGFYMNSGSFGPTGAQNVLKFWYSTDLIHWEYLPELDLIAPPKDGKDVRLDCMSVIHDIEKQCYYGYATGHYNFLRSDDGVHWEFCDGQIDSSPFPAFKPEDGGFEIADCFCFDGSYYMLCGAFGYLGTSGYGVYVFRSDSPFGPFRPDFPAFLHQRNFKALGQYVGTRFSPKR